MRQKNYTYADFEASWIDGPQDAAIGHCYTCCEDFDLDDPKEHEGPDHHAEESYKTLPDGYIEVTGKPRRGDLSQCSEVDGFQIQEITDQEFPFADEDGWAYRLFRHESFVKRSRND